MLIREVRASNAEGDALVVTLHRALTVVHGLHPDEQLELADILASVIYGRTEDLGGQIELDGAGIDVHAWSARVGEDLDDLDVFLRRSDVAAAVEMAAASGAPAETPAVVAARGALDRAREAAAAAEQQLAAARQRAEAARAAVGALGTPPPSPVPAPASPPEVDGVVAGLRSQLEAAETAVAAAESALAAAEGMRAAAAQRLEQLTEELAAAEAAVTDAEAAEAQALSAEEAAASVGPEGDATPSSDSSDVDPEMAALVAAARVAAATAREETEAQRSALEDARTKLVAATAELDAAEAADTIRRARAEAAAVAARAREAEATARRNAADAAMAEADAAEAAVAVAAEVVEAASAELQQARIAAAAAATAETDALEQRAEEIETGLARARAEVSLLTGFAETSRAHAEGSGGRARRRGVPRDEEPVDHGRDVDGPAALAAVEAEARSATIRAGELRAAAEAMRAAWETGLAGGAAESPEAGTKLAELEADLAALGVPVDLGAVEKAARNLRDVPGERALDEARQVLAEIDELVTTRASVSVRSAPTWLVEGARTALEEARVELARAEEMARPMRVTPEETAEFERVHAAVLDAEAKAERRFGGPGARRRLEKALADERELLLKFSLPSYTAFLLRTMPISSDSAAAHHLAEAQRAMADAEAVWEELHRAEYPEEVADLEQREASALARAAALLGPERMDGADVSSPAATLQSVRALLADFSASEGSVERAAQRLAESLDATFGAGTSESGADPAGLLELAERLVGESSRDAAVRESLAAEITALTAAVDTQTEAVPIGTAPPDEATIAAAEAAAAQAEEEAADARRRLEMAAVAAGIAPAAAAVAADAAVLHAASGDGDGSSFDGDRASGDGSGSDPAAADEDTDWSAQTDAEVESSLRQIAALEEELAAVEALRSARGAGAGPAPDGPADDRVTELTSRLAAAETELARTRAAAEEAAAAAATAIDRLEPPEVEIGEVHDDSPGDTEAARERWEAARAHVASLELALADADRRLASATSDLEAAEEDLAERERRIRQEQDRLAAAARDAMHQREAALAAARQEREAARDRRQAAEQAQRDAADQLADATAALELAQPPVSAAQAAVEARRSDADARRREVAVAEGDASARAAADREVAERAAQAAADQLRAWTAERDELAAEERKASQAETEATRALSAARTELDAAQSTLNEAERVSSGPSAVAVAAVDDLVRQRLVAARSRQRFGPVPLILLDPFGPEEFGVAAPLLSEAMSDVQLVFLTGDDGVVRWADTLGPDRALILRFGDPVASTG